MLAQLFVLVRLAPPPPLASVPCQSLGCDAPLHARRSSIHAYTFHHNHLHHYYYYFRLLFNRSIFQRLLQVGPGPL